MSPLSARAGGGAQAPAEDTTCVRSWRPGVSADQVPTAILSTWPREGSACQASRSSWLTGFGTACSHRAFAGLS